MMLMLCESCIVRCVQNKDLFQAQIFWLLACSNARQGSSPAWDFWTFAKAVERTRWDNKLPWYVHCREHASTISREKTLGMVWPANFFFGRPKISVPAIWAGQKIIGRHTHFFGPAKNSLAGTHFFWPAKRCFSTETKSVGKPRGHG